MMLQINSQDAAELAAYLRTVRPQGHDQEVRVFQWVKRLEAAAGEHLVGLWEPK